jgi:hypothetical protein
MAPVVSQSILFMIIGITMFMFLAIVLMVTFRARGGVVMTGAAMAGTMTGTKL